MARVLLTRGRELIRSRPLLFAVLVVWAFAPLVSLIVYVQIHGGVLTGANGSDAFDQMAYLAWIRDEGSHLLASDLWQIAPTAHDYLHPMFVISGLLWRLGLPIQVAYLVWKPIAVLVLFLGFAAYIERVLPDRRQQTAALVLALFYLSPVTALAQWTGSVSPLHRLTLVLATDDADSALNLWGFDHTAITIAMIPVFLLAAEKAVTAYERRMPTRGWVALASIAGGLVSWLHPWQGPMLIGVVVAVAVLRRSWRRYVVLIVPVIATGLPLLYGFVLDRFDPVWHTFEQRTIGTGTAPWWALVASFGPLAAFAAFGVRRPRSDQDLMLLLLLVAYAIVYFVVPEFPPHALSGVTLPLAVLAIRGWTRMRAWQGGRLPLPRYAMTAAAVTGIAVFTVPGAVYHAQGSADVFGNTVSDVLGLQLEVLTPNQAAALSYIDHASRPGPVLAPWLLSMSVPEFTGRQAFAGHQMWQPPHNVFTDGLFYTPTLKDPTGAYRRGLLRDTGAVFVIADCNSPPGLATALAPVAPAVKRFGCVTVYERS
jgi:hypothetical protein